MEILIVWAVFALIIISNIKKAKKMQNERMQEHQRNMQDHNQNAPEYGRNMHQMQNNSSGNGSLSHGANLNKKNDSDAQSAPYMVNSYGEKQYIDPSVQTYSGAQKMTSAETEKLKQEIRSRNNFNGKNVTSHRAEAPVPQYVTPPPAADNAAPAMKTLDKAEFHSPVMQAGSTGTYSDMTGGHTFTQYDCGHEYNDEIVPQSQTGGKAILDDIKFDKNEMRKAFVMQEILKRTNWHTRCSPVLKQDSAVVYIKKEKSQDSESALQKANVQQKVTIRVPIT